MNVGSFVLSDAAATERAGAALAAWMQPRTGGVLFLCGELGAGKTSLARGLLRACGIEGPVRSPSYTLVEPYQSQGHTLLHMDLYRLRDPEELEGLGLRDFAPDQAWWIVEWPERGAMFLPPPTLRIELSLCGAGRQLHAEMPGASLAGQARLRALLQSACDPQQTEP